MKYFLFNPDTNQALTKAVDKYTQLLEMHNKLESSGNKVEIAGIIIHKDKVTGIEPEYAVPMEVEYRLPEKPPIFDKQPHIPSNRKKFAKVIIKFPIWKEPRSVGIKHELITDDIEMQISYRDKKGKLLYPDPFYMDKKHALSYPMVPLKKNTKVFVHIIPIIDFVVNPRDLDRIREAPDY